MPRSLAVPGRQHDGLGSLLDDSSTPCRGTRQEREQGGARARRRRPTAGGVAAGLSLALLGATLITGPVSARADRIPLAVGLEQQGYEQIAQRDGVTVYKHRSASEIRLGAESRLPAPPDEVMAALLDYPGQVGRIKRLSESRVLAYRQGWLLVYQRLNLPVIDDRDFTLEVSWGRDREVRWIQYRVAPNGGPAARRGVVRVSLHEGSWQLRPVDGGRATLVRFMVRMDMGGWVPRWMVRGGSAKELPTLFQSVRGLLARAPERRVAWFPK